MQLLIDDLTREVKTWAGAVISGLKGKRWDVFVVAVKFARGELPAGATGVLGIKASGVFTGDFLASASSWVKSGRGPDTRYLFALDLNQAGLEAAFDAEPASVACSLEVAWSWPGVRQSSLVVPYVIYNGEVRGNEGAATPSGVWRFAQVDDGTVRGVAVQVLGAGDAWVDQVRFVEAV
jgi:hypothetical protein